MSRCTIIRYTGFRIIVGTVIIRRIVMNYYIANTTIFQIRCEDTITFQTCKYLLVFFSKKLNKKSKMMKKGANY